MKEYEILVGEIEAGKAFAQAKTKQQAQTLTLVEIPEEGKELTVELRDPSTMESFPARVIFFSDPAGRPEMDLVHFVNQATRGSLTKRPWAVKIIERIEEEEEKVNVLPTRKLSLSERRGTLLKSLLEARDEKAKN